MRKSAYVGVYQLLNLKMHGETVELERCSFIAFSCFRQCHFALLCAAEI